MSPPGEFLQIGAILKQARVSLGLCKNDPVIRFPYEFAQSLQSLSKKPSFF